MIQFNGNERFFNGISTLKSINRVPHYFLLICENIFQQIFEAKFKPQHFEWTRTKNKTLEPRLRKQNSTYIKMVKYESGVSRVHIFRFQENRATVSGYYGIYRLSGAKCVLKILTRTADL